MRHSDMFDVEVFIQAVKERPALYCPRHELYKKKEARVRLWNEIGDIMYSDWATLSEHNKRSKVLMMQKKWKSLKDSFNRELRQKKLRQLHKPRKQYEFYERLSFLLYRKGNVARVAAAPRHGFEFKAEALQEQDLDLDASDQHQCTQSFLQEEAFAPLRRENPPKRRLPEEEAFRQRWPWEEWRADGGAADRAADRAEDGDRLFLMSFADDMKKLSLSTKYWVKMKFSEIMHQAAMSLCEYQEEENSACTSSGRFQPVVVRTAEGTRPEFEAAEQDRGQEEKLEGTFAR